MYPVDTMPDDIKQKIQRKIFQSGETILLAEEKNNYVYFLSSGIAEAFVLNPNGSIATIYLYRAGEFFGEAEQFYNEKMPVTITATTLCMVDILHKDDFFKWMQADFEFTKLIIREIARKLMTNAELIEELTLLTVGERLLRCIAMHYRRNTLDSLTKAQLSKEVNAPIRSINREIVKCAKQGLLIYENKKIVVINEKSILKHLP